jgi:hypothetical protein
MLRKIKLLKSNNIILLSLLITGLSYSQDQHSINLTTDNMIFQNGRFYGGVEFDNKFTNGVYVRPQIHYADLNGKDYLETSSGIGWHVALNRFETTQFIAVLN